MMCTFMYNQELFGGGGEGTCKKITFKVYTLKLPLFLIIPNLQKGLIYFQKKCLGPRKKGLYR